MANLGDTGPLYGSCQEENAKCQQLHKNTECWNTERSGMSRRYIIEYDRDMQRSSRKDLQIMGITKTHQRREHHHRDDQGNNKTKTYKISFSEIQGQNSFSWTGLVIEESLKPTVIQKIFETNFSFHMK